MLSRRALATDLLKLLDSFPLPHMEAIKAAPVSARGQRTALADPLERTTVKRRLAILVALTLLVRVPLVWSAAGLPAHIVDEQHYVALATSLANGEGFAWSADNPTSIRPPLYPFFIATLWRLSGSQDFQVVRWAQLFLGLASVMILYSIGRRWFDERAAFMAAIGLAIYPSLLFSGVLLLTETLFVTLLLFTVLSFARYAERPSAGRAFISGAALGLAALARSIMWPFIVIAGPLIWIAAGRRDRAERAGAVLALVLGYVCVVGPWAARNTALQGTMTVVDTMGGLNLLMGNYEHTPEDRMWDAVSLTGPQAWYQALPAAAPDGGRWTEGKKEKWAQRQAIEFMTAHPGVTLRRAVLKFADFWGLERDFVAGIQRGYYTPPGWLAAVAAVGITLGYAAAATLAVIGIFLSPPGRTAHLVLLSIILFVAGVHTIVFGHSRYHLPLIPLMLLYASAAISSGAWRQLTKRPAGLAAIACTALLLLIWSRELVVRDWDKIQQLLGTGL
jgi:4-amino-4-deoxy-L-arabinose transferase-like glycosyltransferase